MQNAQELDCALQKSLQSLNTQQLEAVKHIDGALLVLAGAGSGKTKTLTTRLAYLIKEVGIPATNTLTLTFTNKAANEMKMRAMELLGESKEAPPLLCTFHRFGLLFLKFYIHLLGRDVNFTLLDTQDCKKIVKTLAPEIQPARTLAYISSYKNKCLNSSVALKDAHSPEFKALSKAYMRYEEYLLAHNALDFDDLLYLTYEILSSNTDIARQKSEQYGYIMVDEYQDTNELQYKILSLLTCTHQNICVVGDDDQSIYSWRGADISNILQFEKRFNNATIIKLEENYRSTPQILEVANTLIAHNTKRLGKNLKSQKTAGNAVSILTSPDETSEGNLIASIIKKAISQGASAQNFAILFRLNALSRSIEDALNRAKIPYKLIGAQRFYERAEVKDIISFLRFFINENDDLSLLRIINKPKRGIGKITQERLQSFAKDKGLSIYASFCAYPKECLNLIGQKNFSVLEEFFALLTALKKRIQGENSMLEFITTFEESFDFSSDFAPLERVDRMANIDEFYGVLRDYFIQNPDESLQEFLNNISLSSSSDEYANECVSCMSVHSAKGLEFESVFVIGLEEGFFPMILNDSDIEEERRLGYVAFTRAKEQLYLSSADSRLFHGKRENHLIKSRFLAQSGVSANKEDKIPPQQDNQNNDTVAINDTVRHKIFGDGRVIEIEKNGDTVILKINFGGMVRNITRNFVQKV